MPHVREHTLDGTHGRIAVREWPHPAPRYLALVVHGYGEHAGRYDGLADVLTGHGAAGYAPDHAGHGRSAGERVVIEDFEDVVTDVHAVAVLARAAHPGLPLVLVGHSMGGLIAARYAQRYGSELTALILSGPVIGAWASCRGGCWPCRRSRTPRSARPRCPGTRPWAPPTPPIRWCGTGR
ncbi:alpha/beta fold hydrolase [Streptomyces sp. NPDC020192]|uniref:alpha/beta fold hydrolase n=1 Tax=Streptomyces sp. NPDC020192 TaxID=3365066 RepID=UPI0037BCA7FA